MNTKQEFNSRKVFLHSTEVCNKRSVGKVYDRLRWLLITSYSSSSSYCLILSHVLGDIFSNNTHLIVCCLSPPSKRIELNVSQMKLEIFWWFPNTLISLSQPRMKKGERRREIDGNFTPRCTSSRRERKKDFLVNRATIDSSLQISFFAKSENPRQFPVTHAIKKPGAKYSEWGGKFSLYTESNISFLSLFHSSRREFFSREVKFLQPRRIMNDTKKKRRKFQEVPKLRR